MTEKIDMGLQKIDGTYVYYGATHSQNQRLIEKATYRLEGYDDKKSNVLILPVWISRNKLLFERFVGFIQY